MPKAVWGLGLIVLLALGWTGYWQWTAASLRAELSTWLDDRRAEGWQAEARAIEIGGFPVTFRTNIEALALAYPQTGVAWSAPEFGITQPTWDRSHAQFVLPPRQTLRTTDSAFVIQNDRFTVDLSLDREAADYAVTSAVLRADTVTVETTTEIETGVLVSVADVTATIEAVGEAEYDIVLAAGGVVFPGPALELSNTDLPQALETARLDLRATFDRPWDIQALEARRPQPTALDLRVFDVSWGPMAIRMAGQVSLDTAGIPTGSVAIQAQNWRDMLALVAQTGRVSPTVVQTLREGLQFLSRLSGGPESLDINLRLASGQVFIGFVPLGPAPAIRLR